MTTISLTSLSALTGTCDVVVVGVGRKPLPKPRRGAKAKRGEPGHELVLASGAEQVDDALGGGLRDALDALGAAGKAGETTRLPTRGALKAPLVLAVGLGDVLEDGAGYGEEVLRRAAGAASRALAGKARAVVALPLADPAAAAAVAEGALLGAYSFDTYRSGDGGKAPVAEIVLATAANRSAGFKTAVAGAEIVAEAVALVRDLVNTPPNDLHPVEFADRAKQAADGIDRVEVEVLDEKALRKGGFGGILGVGQGSVNPPRLVRVAYTHPKAKRHLALVGKGITFDSGGLSLKPGSGMVTMKDDMSGAAAVVGAVLAIARLGLRVNVTAWAPLAENMPSGSAIRPSDVLRMYGGKTVEVLNTDAEGRLVLADAIVRAGEEKPDAIVDVATLTGAQLVALGTRTSGIMANDDGFRDALHATSKRTGEDMWPMPLPDHLRASLDSPVADLANIGDRMGGMLVAGVFLREFVPEGTTWAHLDIAGPAFNEGGPRGYTPKGATGEPVRTLVRLAAEIADGTIELG